MFLLGLNVIIAVVVAMTFDHIQRNEAGLNPSTTESQYPEITETPYISNPYNPNFDTTSNNVPDPIHTTNSAPPKPKYNLNPRIDSSHTVEWAVLDMKTGLFAGSDNWSDPIYLMSIIKPWIAADWFNDHPNPNSTTLSQLSSMIVDSNDTYAYKYFQGQPSWDRFVKACGITDIVYRSWSWSLTQI